MFERVLNLSLEMSKRFPANTTESLEQHLGCVYSDSVIHKKKIIFLTLFFKDFALSLGRLLSGVPLNDYTEIQKQLPRGVL